MKRVPLLVIGSLVGIAIGVLFAYPRIEIARSGYIGYEWVRQRDQAITIIGWALAGLVAGIILDLRRRPK